MEAAGSFETLVTSTILEVTSQGTLDKLIIINKRIRALLIFVLKLRLSQRWPWRALPSVTPHSPVEINCNSGPRFPGWSKAKASRRQGARWLFCLWLAWLTLRTWKQSQIVPPKCQWTSVELHGLVYRRQFCSEFFVYSIHCRNEDASSSDSDVDRYVIIIK
jgi:hypothetical protein